MPQQAQSVYSRSCERSLQQGKRHVQWLCNVATVCHASISIWQKKRTSPPFMYHQCIMLHPFDSRNSSVSAANKVLMTQVPHAIACRACSLACHLMPIKQPALLKCATCPTVILEGVRGQSPEVLTCQSKPGKAP